MTTAAENINAPFAGLVEIDMDAAPGVELTTLDQRNFTLNDFVGKVRLIHFWATWCPPCVEEIPDLESLEQRYADKPLQVLAIATDNHNDVNAFRYKHQTRLKILVDQYGGAMRDYHVKTLPTTFILDKRGRLRYAAQGRVAWNSARVRKTIDELLDEKQ